MGANSHIEWTDHSFNPWEGCTKVSPGCAHCYAEARNIRFSAGANWGKGAPRRRTSAANWRQPLAWNRSADPGEYWKREYPWFEPPPRVFCASLADWLDDEVPIEWTADFLDLVRQCQNLDWLLLTKRPQNWRPRLESVWKNKRPLTSDPLSRWLTGEPPENVWIGATVEDQPHADERIPLLLQIPAKVRFLSCEPLLGPVDLKLPAPSSLLHASIGWVICGGESGRHARPMHPDWARSLRDQCAAAGVPFFFKQWGEWAPCEGSRAAGYIRLPHGCHDRATLHHFPDGQPMARSGKATAGRLLDGQEHNAFPC